MARLRKSGRIARNLGHYTELVRQLTGLDPDAALFSLDLARLFPRPAALEVEIGSGKGDFVIERARQFPQRNFLAIELDAAVFRYLAQRCVRNGLPNLRAVRADARSMVNLMLPAGGVRAYHVYFPDPWPKNRHSKHRLFTPALAAGIARSLAPDGRLYVATDVEWYFQRIRSLLEDRGFRVTEERACAAAQTGFGRKFMALGLPIYSACFQIFAGLGG
jgi:tRNA (guanine-N7-)-methyltransferase